VSRRVPRGGNNQQIVLEPDRVVALDEALRGEIAKTRRVQGNLLDAVEPGKTNAESAAKLIKGI